MTVVNKNFRRLILSTLLYFYCYMGALVAGLSFLGGVSPLFVLRTIRDAYSFPAPYVTYVGFHIYIFPAFIPPLVFFVRDLIRRRKGKRLPEGHFPPVLSQLGLIMIFFLFIIQTSNHIQLTKNEIRKFHGSTLGEKQEFFHGTAVDFAEFCRNLSPGRHRGQFITDWDIHREPYRWEHRKLAYYLYPTIDIRGVTERPLDCLVFVAKEDARRHVPPDYEILGVFNQESLLAVKKGVRPSR